ncbi:DUF1636 domain-containing protein [Labrenzia sp. PHM005]|uniref:DUF1636 family protein n=1 Tax=Labrenzia sp. PHM005 TaxID=2590016 RepID=UPI00113FD70A|nr:DUF1636 domain-containing protein [Labrenzia sp. PHM005]QDG76692.1 DUF1636 domain-containing protein [Labrenzia sp. PHM005]
METSRHTSHRITVCTSCRHKGSNCKPGYDLIEKLQAALQTAGKFVSDDFEISGVACMAGCSRPCTVAFHGSQKATYLFGDIDPEEDVTDLITFARQYAELPDGWCSSGERPGKLRRTALARVPAAIIVSEETEMAVQ